MMAAVQGNQELASKISEGNVLKSYNIESNPMALKTVGMSSSPKTADAAPKLRIKGLTD